MGCFCNESETLRCRLVAYHLVSEPPILEKILDLFIVRVAFYIFPDTENEEPIVLLLALISSLARCPLRLIRSVAPTRACIVSRLEHVRHACDEDKVVKVKLLGIPERGVRSPVLDPLLVGVFC